jgi:hypothetical protein
VAAIQRYVADQYGRRTAEDDGELPLPPARRITPGVIVRADH